MSPKTIDNLKQIFGGVHNRHPQRHPIVEIIVDYAMDNLTSDDFEIFWSACIEEHLAKQHWEKKYIAVDTLSYAFARAKEIHLSLFLQGETVRCIRNGLSEYKHPAREFLAKISQQFCLSVKQLLENRNGHFWLF